MRQSLPERDDDEGPVGWNGKPLALPSWSWGSLVLLLFGLGTIAYATVWLIYKGISGMVRILF